MDCTGFDDIKRIFFCIYTSEEIERLSVLHITNPEVLDNLGHPIKDGLHDLRLGPNEQNDVCETCGLTFYKCPGHSGHITLPTIIYNPVFFPQVYQLVRGSCLECHRLTAPKCQLYLVLYKLKLLDYGLVSAVKELDDILTDTSEESILDVAVVQKKLKSRFEAAVQGCLKDSFHTESVVECRRHIVKDFIRRFMMCVTGKCPHCLAPKKKLSRHSTNMKIMYVDNNEIKVASTHSSEPDDDKPTSEMSVKEMLPSDVRKHLILLWENDKIFLKSLFKIVDIVLDSETLPIEMFFMKTLYVPASRFRRISTLRGRKFIDSQTEIYSEILKCSYAIRILAKCLKGLPPDDETEKDIIKIVPGKTDIEKLSYLQQRLQSHVFEIYDSETNKTKDRPFSKGIKQRLEKKEGILRMNMMGKRVNYSARSVISPDPNINVNEIGIPEIFAKKLTYPEPVTQFNYEKLRQAVKNGPNVFPGAILIEYEDGRVMRLNPTDASHRSGVANTLLTPPASVAFKKLIKPKIIHRHLRDGDMLLLNRQPTLHKPSIMAHKARVLPHEKTLRLHYANCKSYNADFDGDEMNAHLPQAYPGQSECHNIVSVNHQYLVPKDGTPLSGLIQDHIIAGTLITIRGRFFTKNDYQQLLYNALSFSRKRLKLLPPTILKPKELWSGKQLISSVIINLIPEGRKPPTIEGKSKVSTKNWKNGPTRYWIAGGCPLTGDNMSESEVVIRGGELLCGIIDKAQVGPTPYSLIHVCYELYGGEVSSTMLTALALLFMYYLQYHSGFSLGIEDIMVTNEANRKREKILKIADVKGLEASCKALEIEIPESDDENKFLKRFIKKRNASEALTENGLLKEFKANLLKKSNDAHYKRDDFQLKLLDMEMKKVTQELNNDVKDACMPNGLIKKFPSNNLQLMIESGAKGSMVNAMQISCLLGQIELEGRRMPLMLNGSTLPSFAPCDTSPAAGGFVSGRFLTGIKVQEYFFHCMAGREGLIDTAVKTSRSGYLQRCLIKHLEGIIVNYDLTVRDSDGTVIQFLYGEDGLDVTKMQMLQEPSFRLLAQNFDAAVNENHVQMLKDRVDVDIPKLKRRIEKWKMKHAEQKEERPLRNSLIQSLAEDKISIKQRINNINKILNSISKKDFKSYKKLAKKCPDPINAYNRPDTVFGSISEKMDELISNYIDQSSKNGTRDLQLSPEKFQDLCYYRAQKALAEPGEAVGLLAAQSLGEPSTQMTLNTFHFAGKGEMNVTLGIPRIREILMTASPNIATPTMDLPLLDKPDIIDEAEKLRLQLNPVSLKEVLDSIKVKESYSIHSYNNMNYRNYVIRFNFLKYSVYKGISYTTPSKILFYMEHVFFKRIIIAIKKKQRQATSSDLIEVRKDVSAGFSKFGKAGSDDNSAPAETENPRAADEADSSGDEEDGDGDATTLKQKKNHDQEQDYDDPEEGEMLPEEMEDENEAEQNIVIKKEVLSDEEDQDVPLFENHAAHSQKSVSDDQKLSRMNAVKCIHGWISGYDFDVKNERWCELTLQMNLSSTKIDVKTLLEEEAGKALVHYVPYIKEALLVKNPDSTTGNKMIKTNGVNFLEVFKYVDILDINKAYSNNIHAIAEIYGIEAAARAIKKEISNVFKPYGISVDPRHLSLISDYMTSSGYYRPCNRIGMENSASPMQQMTFETTKNFLVDSMLLGVPDEVKGPSSNLMVGQVVDAGTGMFDLLGKILKRTWND